MTYTIQLLYAHIEGKLHTRKRRDAAALKFERVVYDAIKSNAWLDTQAGRRCYEQAKRARTDNHVRVVIGPFIAVFVRIAS